jgi:hypothetical protein
MIKGYIATAAALAQMGKHAARFHATAARGIRSQAECDKRIVPERHGERQEGQHFVGNDQEKNWCELLY